MRKVESLSIRYLGYKDPETLDEVELEILGLETVIAAAKQRISVLSQGIKLKEIMSQATEDSNEKTAARFISSSANCQRDSDRLHRRRG